MFKDVMIIDFSQIKSQLNAYKMVKEELNNIKYSRFSIHGIIDRNIMELFFNEDNEGYSVNTLTNSFFFIGGNFIKI